MLPLASRPLFQPAPHQVQRGAAAQVLHDNPQLRALGPEKCLSACIWQEARSPQTPRHTPWGPSRALPQRAPAASDLPSHHTHCGSFADRPSAQTGNQVHCANNPSKTRLGEQLPSPHSASTPANQVSLRSPQPALGSGLQLQGSLPQCYHPGLLDAAPWGLPQPRDMVQPGEALGHTANPEPLRLQTLLVPGHCQGSPKDETR